MKPLTGCPDFFPFIFGRDGDVSTPTLADGRSQMLKTKIQLISAIPRRIGCLIIFVIFILAPSPSGSRGRVRTAISSRRSKVLGPFRPGSGGVKYV